MFIQYSCALKEEQREGGPGRVCSNGCASLFIQYSRLVLFKQGRAKEAVMVVLVCRSAKVAPTAIVREHLYRAAHTPSPPPHHCCPSFLDNPPTHPFLAKQTLLLFIGF